MKAVKLVVVITVAVAALAFHSSYGSAQHVTGTLGSPNATTTISGKQLPPPDPKFGGVIKERASESKAWWPPRVVPPKRAPNILLDHDRRRRLRRAGHLRRRRSDSGPGSHRQEWAALHQFPFHVAVLAHAGGNHHRPQPSLCGLRGSRRNRDGVPGLRLDHPDREGHHRHHPEGQRVRDLVVRQGPQHAVFREQPGRAVQSMARTVWASNISTALSAATPASWQPNLFRNTTAIYPFLNNPGWKSDHGHGRRGHPVHEAAQRAGARKAVLDLLRHPAARMLQPASSDEGMDRQDQRHASLRPWLEKLRSTIFANQKKLGIMPEKAQLTPWPDGQEAYGGEAAQVGSCSAGRRSSSSGKRRSTGVTGIHRS